MRVGGRVWRAIPKIGLHGLNIASTSGKPLSSGKEDLRDAGKGHVAALGYLEPGMCVRKPVWCAILKIGPTGSTSARPVEYHYPAVEGTCRMRGEGTLQPWSTWNKGGLVNNVN
jgi:hypothetical protein